MKVKLTKLSNNHNNLRTKEVIGSADKLPVVGERFVMTSRPLDQGASVRLISTSPVTGIYHDFNLHSELYTIKTENSTYLIEVLDKHGQD